MHCPPGGLAMKARFTVCCALLIAGLGDAPAQEPSGRLDLDLMSALPRSELVAARIVFSKSSARCPEDHGIVHATGGRLMHHRASVFRGIRSTAEYFRPIEDDTYRYRMASADCRVDLSIRQQLRQADDSWTSL